ncbi:MAG: hypothetical protein CGW95_01740 [Phenylobacterium zucineum]|nr:MAG: hypothetical protein CGW95_01740 [Phenylobacterium zucineum]
MSNVHAIRKARPEPLFLFDARRPLQPADPEMISRLITHADQATRLPGGRLRLRISSDMIGRLQAQGKLGAGDYRLSDLTVDWDEAEGQVIRVRDDARLRDASARWADWDALWDEDSYRPDIESLHAVAA